MDQRPGCEGLEYKRRKETRSSIKIINANVVDEISLQSKIIQLMTNFKNLLPLPLIYKMFINLWVILKMYTLVSPLYLE